MTFSPLISGTLPYHRNGGGYKCSSRQGQSIVRAVQHHWAGTSGGIERLTNPGIDASANYLITSDGKIYGQVPEEYRAWTSGSFEADAPSITYEVQNTAGAVSGNDDNPSSWPVSEAAYNAIIRLTADIAKRYSWGAVAAGNYMGHRQFLQTACPGGYLWNRMQQTRDKANAILKGVSVAPAPSTPPAAGKSVWQLANEVMAGLHGNGDARRRSLGAQADAVQAEVNRRLGVSTPAKPLPKVKTIAQLADEVMAGVYGNGEERRRRLGSQADAVQAEVNRRLGASRPAPSAGPSISQLADAVMRGEYGNGAERVRRLGSKASAVQAEINRRYGL